MQQLKPVWKELSNLWQPPPNLQVDQWADSHRKLSSESSAEAGQWRTDRVPFQREIMQVINDPSVEEVVFIKSAQVGATEILLNTIGYYIDQEPSTILCIQPSLSMAQAFSKDRLAPMLRDTPNLKNKVKDARTRDAENTTMHKKFSGGSISLVGANSDLLEYYCVMRLIDTQHQQEQKAIRYHWVEKEPQPSGIVRLS